MSIHGICFDEGQAGRCGLECEGFLNYECEIPDEIIEIFKEQVLVEKFGELRLAVLRAQTKFEFNELIQLEKILFDDYGYVI